MPVNLNTVLIVRNKLLLVFNNGFFYLKQMIQITICIAASFGNVKLSMKPGIPLIYNFGEFISRWQMPAKRSIEVILSAAAFTKEILFYIEDESLRLDFKILCKTASRVLFGKDYA
jgi:hypothetical protein